jgi:hypothetical protein
VAMHFALNHSDNYNKVDTGLISATFDIIRALKIAYLLPVAEDSHLDPKDIIIMVIFSSQYYRAKELFDRALKTRPEVPRRSQKHMRGATPVTPVSDEDRRLISSSTSSKVQKLSRLGSYTPASDPEGGDPVRDLAAAVTQRRLTGSAAGI